ncbi:hypothetical protein [Tenacibaculum sp. 190524A02b]|uniref:hypothetical protein n=1 Tax=Tenacibaculum vairaonense TaxID=3137860 RepID=UPI0031FAEC52
MNRDAINIALHRNLKKGTKYDKLVPKSDCSSVFLANGDTEVAINKMAVWAKRYQHHTKKLTEKEFASYSLAELCKEIHSFTYHHLQYKIDGYNQLLRSPACAWKTRAEGLDCKSYSIFASTILLNRGVKHYFRRVIVSKGESYSHVYVIVPLNQETGKLDKGYYVIDGTINTLEEQPIYKADDVYMLPNATNSLNGAFTKHLASGFGKLVSAGVDSLLEELNSCSGSRYDIGKVSFHLREDLQKVLQNKISLLDEAIEAGNNARIENIFNEVLKEVDLGFHHLENEVAYSTYDDCEIDVLTQVLPFARNLRGYFDTYLQNFINTQERFKVNITTENAMTSERTYYFVVGAADNPVLGEYRQIKIKSDPAKYGVIPVVPFGEDTGLWLDEVARHLSWTYADGREKEYKQKAEPILVHIEALRQKVFLGGEMLYYYEKPFHRNLLELYKKYDTNYNELVKKEYKNLYLANEAAIKSYKEKLQAEITENKAAYKRKEMKKHFGYGVAALAVIYLIYINKKSYDNT